MPNIHLLWNMHHHATRKPALMQQLAGLVANYTHHARRTAAMLCSTACTSALGNQHYQLMQILVVINNCCVHQHKPAQAGTIHVHRCTTGASTDAVEHIQHDSNLVHTAPQQKILCAHRTHITPGVQATACRCIRRLPAHRRPGIWAAAPTPPHTISHHYMARARAGCMWQQCHRAQLQLPTATTTSHTKMRKGAHSSAGRLCTSASQSAQAFASQERHQQLAVRPAVAPTRCQSGSNKHSWLYHQQCTKFRCCSAAIGVCNDNILHARWSQVSP